jgi:hypothetical protein
MNILFGKGGARMTIFIYSNSICLISPSFAKIKTKIASQSIIPK